MYPRLARAADWLARGVAMAGGVVLLGVTVMVCVSIIGRALGGLGLRPVPGDFELVEIGVGLAVFAMLPWCHLSRGHARVDLLAPLFGRRGNRLIDVIAEAAMLAAAALIAWRLWAGLLDKKAYGETTFILQLPLWWAYAGAMLGAAAFVLIAGFCLLRALRALTGRAE